MENDNEFEDVSDIDSLNTEDELNEDDFNELFKKININDHKEVQAHGFIWEKDLLKHVYGATDDELKKIKYTNKDDLPGNLNKLEPGVIISVKTSGSNSIAMGDAKRVFESLMSDKKIHLVIIQYKQEGLYKKLKQIYEIDMTKSKDEMFGSITINEINKLITEVRNVPHKRSPTPEEYDKMYNLRNEIEKKTKLIGLDIKCNSQQSRLQCSFKLIEFIKTYPKRLIAKSDNGNFRGGKINEKIKSDKRKFNL